MCSSPHFPLQIVYIGETSSLELTKGKVYTVISIEKNWYRIQGDTGEDYLYPPELFDVILVSKQSLLTYHSFVWFSATYEAVFDKKKAAMLSHGSQ